MSATENDIFDAHFATNQFSGNQALLIKILAKFISQHHNFDSLLAKQVEENQIDAAKQHVHTVKGVSGNLGMVALHRACTNFEYQFDTGITAQQLEEISQVFQDTLKEIKQYSENQNPAEQPAQAEQSNEKNALLNALKNNEFISDSKLQQFLQGISIPAIEKHHLTQAINDLDYPKAIGLLE